MASVIFCAAWTQAHSSGLNDHWSMGRSHSFNDGLYETHFNSDSMSAMKKKMKLSEKSAIQRSAQVPLDLTENEKLLQAIRLLNSKYESKGIQFRVQSKFPDKMENCTCA